MATDDGTGTEVMGIPGVRDDHGCFGCGRLNPHGLRLRFSLVDQGAAVQAAFTPRPQDEGYGGVVHGGIVATLLDEVMAWACYARDAWVVTATIQIRYRRPVEVGTPLIALGRVARDRGRILEAAGELRRAADGALLAEATATFARVPEAQAEVWRTRYLAACD